MNKNQIRKEIAALIDSIKDHSDNIGDKQHITQLELELILSKVKKLYEKSIVYNYLNSLPAPHTLHTLDPINEMLSKGSSTIGHHRSETLTSIDLATPSTLSLSEDDVAPKDKSEVGKKSHPDMKSLIGLNQKFQFINVLFDNDATAFNNTLAKIDALNTLPEAIAHLKALADEFKWDVGQEDYITFQSIVEKKFN